MSVPNDTGQCPRPEPQGPVPAIREESSLWFASAREPDVHTRPRSRRVRPSGPLLRRHRDQLLSGSDALLLRSWPRTSARATRSSPRRTPSSPPAGRSGHRRQAVFADIDPRPTTSTPPGSRRHHAADQGDHARPSLRPDRRHGPDPGDRPAARPAVIEDAAQAIGAATRAAAARSATLPLQLLSLQEPGRVRRRRHDHDRRPQLARRMARLRVHGMEPKYHHHESAGTPASTLSRRPSSG